MTRELMDEVYKRIENLEKILMRKLTDKEIEYLFDHTEREFLMNVLDFEDEDILVLLTLKKLISDWCTLPAESVEEHLTIPEGLVEEKVNVDERVYNVLLSIINSLSKDFKRYRPSNRKEKFKILTKRQNIISPDEALNDFEECPDSDFDMGPGVIDDNLNDEQPCDENVFVDNINPEGVESILPSEAEKWMKYLSEDEIEEAIQNACNSLAEDWLKDHDNPFVEKNIDINEDQLAGEILDRIKDITVLHIVENLKNGNTVTFDDEDIQAEVLEYLFDNHFKVKSIDNKVTLL